MTTVPPATRGWTEDMIVTINGVEFATNLYDGVQRFVPDSNVEALVNLSTANFGNHGSRGTWFYDQIPEALKIDGHGNAVVNYMVRQNQSEYFGLNELVLALHGGEFTIDEFIEFDTLHGWSVSGFCDSITSQLSNMGLSSPYIDPEDGEEYEDFSAHFTLHNPLWED